MATYSVWDNLRAPKIGKEPDKLYKVLFVTIVPHRRVIKCSYTGIIKIPFEGIAFQIRYPSAKMDCITTCNPFSHVIANPIRNPVAIVIL